MERVGRWNGRMAVAAAIALGTLAGSSMAAADQEFKMTFQGQERRFLVHLPPSYDASRPAPLLLAFHGGGGGMRIQADPSIYGISAKADKEGAIVAYPSGWTPLRAGGLLGIWNAGNCCGGARDRNIDDVGFARAVVADIEARYAVDRSKIFATGMSNGGIFSERLACEMSDVVSAMASVAGTLGVPRCAPARPVSVMNIHALDDDHVLFNGGDGPASVNPGKEADFASVPDTFEAWRRADSCQGEPKRVLTVTGARCDLYDSCSGESRVELCVTDTGGHSWPGSPAGRRGKTPSQAVSANDLMWDFFLRRSP